MAPERLRQVAEEVREAFPRPIEGHELVVIDVDPSHLHAFWTVPPAAVEAARNTLAEKGDTAPLVLRVHEWSDDRAGAAFDVEVVGLQGQSYIDVWDDARRYRATLGLRAANGGLTPLVASAPVELPALAPAQDARARPAAPKSAEVPIASPPAPSPATVETAGAPAEPVRHPFPLPPAEDGEYDPGLLTGVQTSEQPTAIASEMRASEDISGVATTSSAAAVDTAAEAPVPPGAGNVLPAPIVHPFPLPPAEAGEYVPELLTTHEPGASGPVEMLPPAAAADALPEPVRYDFPLPPMEAGEYVPELIGGFLPPDAPSPEPASEEHPQDAAADQPRAQSGEPAPLPEGGEPLPLPLENVMSLSSFALGREQVEFEVNAELHIFGRAKAGTQLHLFGRKVTLRPDGTFSITRPLPNGALVLSSLLVNGSDDGQSD